MTKSREGRVRRAFRTLGRHATDAKHSVERRFDLFDRPTVLTYRSAGRPDRLSIRGRVVEEKGISGSRDASFFRNVLDTINRLESDEIPGARLAARYGGAEARDEADAEGFFRLELRPGEPVAPGWHEVDVELLGSMAGGEGVKATGEVLVPAPDAEFAVVSDLDDTVIRSEATDSMAQIRILFARNPGSREPMAGAVPLYEALTGAPGGDGPNPFFYVSNSGWGLYDLFVDFLDARGFPRGGMFLQDIAIVEEKSEKLGSEDHKRETILRLMETYPDLAFVLIGDSGQHDPELYRDIVRERGDQVRAVLVRDVTPPERDREVRRVVEEVESSLGVAMAAAESSISLARAAADFGLVPHETIAEVRRGMVEEESRQEER